MDYKPFISLTKDRKKRKIFFPLLNNGNKFKKINRIISSRYMKSNKRMNQNSVPSQLSKSNINKAMNLFNNDFSENHLQRIMRNDKLIPFEEYNNKLNKNFLDYKIVDKDEKIIIKKKRKKKHEVDKDNNHNERESINNEEKVKQKSPTLSRNKSEPYYKVIVNDLKFYENPGESLTTINHNNEIFNEMNKDSLARQRILFENNIKNLEKYYQKFKVKMPKVKVFDSLSKIPDEIPVINLIKADNKNEDESPSETQKKEEEIKLFSYYKYSPKNFPEGKEQFSLCSKGKYLYLSGGLSIKMKQMSIWLLNMETLEWNKLSIKNPIYSRYGHTSIYYQNKIYFFGGTIKIEKTTMLGGLEIFSFIDKTFIISNEKGGPCKRKNHIAELIGNSMFIHGGIDEESNVLDDCYILNLHQMKWSVPMINSSIPTPKLYGHSSCLAVPYNVTTNISFNIYKFPDNDIIIKKGKKNIQRGLYIFGGKTKEFNGLTNNLWILLLGQEPLQWIKAETKGIQPLPRYYHSMNYFEKLGYIIIHGGRNDDLSTSSAINDTFILELINLNWIKVNLYSNIKDFKIISRFGHNSSIYENKLIIFGGVNNNNYIGSSLFIVNLDFEFSLDIMKSAKKIMFDNLFKIKNEDSKKILRNLQKEEKNKLEIISQFNLPPIK